MTTPKSPSPLAPSETPPTPAPFQDALRAAKEHADALAAQATRDAEAALQETLARIGAPEEYAKAGPTIEGLVAWRPEVDRALERTTIPAEVRRTLLELRPGLALAFDTLDRNQNELTDLAITQVPNLLRLRTEYEALSPQDLTPKVHQGECWYHAPIGGPVNCRLWKLRCALGCTRPVADVGNVIARLDAAFQELTDCLGGR